MNLTITEFKDRNSRYGKVVTYTWEELVDKLSHPVRTSETVAEYSKLTGDARTDAKDVGAFVGGEFEKGRRLKDYLKNRCLLAIDVDEGKPGDLQAYGALMEYRFFCHTTHSSTKEEPRLRWIIPLSRLVTPDEYRALVSIVVPWVGAADESTDQPERLMFWPSVCKDGYWEYMSGGDGFLDPDEFLSGYVPPPKDVQEERPVPESDIVIPEGYREKTIMHHLGYLARTGASYNTLLSAAEDYNERCSPPLAQSDLERMARSASRYRDAQVLPAKIQNEIDSFADLGEVRERESESGKGLEGVWLDDLMEKELPPMRFVVDQLIPEGLTVIASQPKLGKSWLCYDLCSSVALGMTFLGFNTTQSTVLYLALEDNEKRIQERGPSVFDGRPVPKNVKIILKAPTMKNGLLDRVKEEFEICRETRGEVGLVVIDTLQKVRDEIKKSGTQYSIEYNEFGPLQEFAMQNNVAIVVVHHKIKTKSENNSLQELNASNGFIGAVDCGIMIAELPRDDPEYKYCRMTVTGRDVENNTYNVRFPKGNKAKCKWENLGIAVSGGASEVDYDNFRQDPIVRTILYNLEERKDLGEDGEEQAVYKVSTEGLRADILAFTGYEAPQARVLGRRISKLADSLVRLAGVGCRPFRGAMGGSHGFEFYYLPDDPS